MFCLFGAQVLDIDLEELPDIFDVLDDGDGEITTEEFLCLCSLHSSAFKFFFLLKFDDIKYCSTV